MKELNEGFFLHVFYLSNLLEVPVVVHGGEGVDSTILVSSLAQVMLDPDARTIRG